MSSNPQAANAHPPLWATWLGRRTGRERVLIAVFALLCGAAAMFAVLTLLVVFAYSLPEERIPSPDNRLVALRYLLGESSPAPYGDGIVVASTGLPWTRQKEDIFIGDCRGLPSIEWQDADTLRVNCPLYDAGRAPILVRDRALGIRVTFTHDD